jgi:hypothetical protein
MLLNLKLSILGSLELLEDSLFRMFFDAFL